MTFDLHCWELAAAVLPHAHRVLLYGPPGTGKTYAAIYDRPPGIDAFVNTLEEDTPVAELRGHFVKNEDGTYRWMDGPAIAAWKTGGRYVINEINRASPETQTFLYAILDDPESAQLTLPHGERVQPAASFSAVATMNGTPDELPEALQDRFSVQIEVDAIHPAALARVTARFRQAAEAAAMAPSHRRLSIRKWLDLQKLLDAGLTLPVAAQACFGSRAQDILRDIQAAELAAAEPKKPAPSEPTDALEDLFPSSGMMPTEEPNCPQCNNKMRRRLRKSDGAPFWGCIAYPACSGTRNIPR